MKSLLNDQSLKSKHTLNFSTKNLTSLEHRPKKEEKKKEGEEEDYLTIGIKIEQIFYFYST